MILAPWGFCHSGRYLIPYEPLSGVAGLIERRRSDCNPRRRVWAPVGVSARRKESESSGTRAGVEVVGYIHTTGWLFLSSLVSMGRSHNMYRLLYFRILDIHGTFVRVRFAARYRSIHMNAGSGE